MWLIVAGEASKRRLRIALMRVEFEHSLKGTPCGIGVAPLHLREGVRQQITLVEGSQARRRCVRRNPRAVQLWRLRRPCTSSVKLNFAERRIGLCEVCPLEKLIAQLTYQGFNECGCPTVFSPLRQRQRNLGDSADGFGCDVAVDRFVETTHSDESIPRFRRAGRTACGEIKLAQRLSRILLQQCSAEIFIQDTPGGLKPERPLEGGLRTRALPAKQSAVSVRVTPPGGQRSPQYEGKCTN